MYFFHLYHKLGHLSSNFALVKSYIFITNYNNLLIKRTIKKYMKTIEGHDVKIFTDNIEENALEQIKHLLSIDVFSDRKIRIMPDVHAGAGCVIGFTGDLGDKVIPNIVGVDIGCGMRVLKLGNFLTLTSMPSMSISARMFLPER